MLAVSSVYSIRDLMIHDEIGIMTIPALAKKFYDFDIDIFFRSTVSSFEIILIFIDH